MTNSTESGVFTITPKPPLRALAIAATASLGGAALIVAGQAAGWRVLGIGGWLLLGAALALAGVALWRWRQGRIRVVVDEKGYLVHGPDGSQQGTWADVGRVARAPGRLTVYRGTEALTISVTDESALDQLGALFGSFLDRNRGYGAGLTS